MALNSWTASHGATFRSPAGDSRIDHILTKHRDADNKAKQGALLDEAPFLPAGAHHVPMLTSLNYKYYRPPRQQQHCFSREVKRKASILEPPAVTLLGACGPQFWGAKRDVKEGVPS